MINLLPWQTDKVLDRGDLISSRLNAGIQNLKSYSGKHFFSKGFRYRLNQKKLPGRPDLVFKKYKTTIFVNGCLWHGHDNCRYNIIPKTRTEFWTDKICGNKKRDAKNYELLLNSGWKVITVWECELKKDKIEETVDFIISQLQNNLR